MTQYILPLADQKATLEVAGGKGASLARLANSGLPVPDGFHVTTAAYRQFVATTGLQAKILAALDGVEPGRPPTLESAARTIGDLFARHEMPPEIAGAIVQAYSSLPGSMLLGGDSSKEGTTSVAVAVRSSATAEDLPGLSFAGQQDTYLNIDGVADLLAAVKRCWASLWTARAIGYRAQHGIDQGAVSLAVVVQLLIPAEAAGIMFTANPVSGARDEAVISAAWGLGEAIVGGIVTPDTITVDKNTGKILAREIATKDVMTVRVSASNGREKGTEERLVPQELRALPVLSDTQVADLVELGNRIERLYERPMDIEWTLLDGKFGIVQARPITALPEPEYPAPTGWPLPQPKGQYMRTSIIDFMPDPLSPLFATLGVPALNRGTLRLLQYLGRTSTEPEFFGDLVVTVNDYAYMTAGYNFRTWLWLIFRLVPAFPRLLRHGVAHWQDEVLPHYAATVQRWEGQPLDSLSAAEILTGVGEILAAAFDNMGALQAGSMGAAAGSEGLFTRVYDKFVKEAGDPPAQACLMGYASEPIQAEKTLYDLAQWTRERPDLRATILATPSGDLNPAHMDGAPADVDSADWREWQERFRGYLKSYGHSIYDLDFAKPVPADDPAPIIETFKMYLRGAGSNPHERQQALEERRLQTTEMALNRLKGLRLKIFRKVLGWAQNLAPLREDGIASLGLGYPRLRQMLRELGRRFEAGGAIEQPDDIFWLEAHEVQQAAMSVDRGAALDDLTDQVRERKAIWRAERRVTPPPMLPPKDRYLGFDTDIWLAASADQQSGDTLKGLGASPGRVSAAARVLLGPEDFDQMQPGDILVAGITTPAWTPLFAMASGIVTDVGGPLSHGSIVAREYGIPAVLGTGVATKRIRSGQTITVDGSTGEVILA